MSLAMLMAAVLCSPGEIDPPPRGTWVRDETRSISGGTVDALNQLAAKLDAEGSGQLGVLIVNSTNGTVPRTFATNAFNHWGVGHPGQGDGVLLFVALGDRKAEIILSTNSRLSTGDTDVVMRDQVVANFKRKNPEGALLDGARALIQLLRARMPAAPPVPQHLSPFQERLGRLMRGEEQFPDQTPRHWVVDLANALSPSERAELDRVSDGIYAEGKGRLYFVTAKELGTWPSTDTFAKRIKQQMLLHGSPRVGVIVLDTDTGRARIDLPADCVRDAWEEQSVQAAERAMNRSASNSLPAAARFAEQAMVRRIPPRPMGEVIEQALSEHQKPLMAGTGGLGVLGIFGLRRWNRYRARRCKNCERPRELLGPGKEDKHLTSAQRTEQQVNSVDYDVWWCAVCRDALIIDNKKFLSGYSSCQSCRARTLSSSSETVHHATEYSTGLVRITQSCRNCSYTSTTERTTAQLSSSSSSSFSSSSSDSGSSFGGGSSDGGGSSGSW